MQRPWPAQLCGHAASNATLSGAGEPSADSSVISMTDVVCSKQARTCSPTQVTDRLGVPPSHREAAATRTEDQPAMQMPPKRARAVERACAMAATSSAAAATIRVTSGGKIDAYVERAVQALPVRACARAQLAPPTCAHASP